MSRAAFESLLKVFQWCSDSIQCGSTHVTGMPSSTKLDQNFSIGGEAPVFTCDVVCKTVDLPAEFKVGNVVIFRGKNQRVLSLEVDPLGIHTTVTLMEEYSKR